MQYDAIIIGGGIAGLQAAIQLGRYRHAIVVIDSHNARSLLCKSYQNLLGWPEGVSGSTLRSSGKLQAERLGVTFIDDEVMSLIHMERGFGASLKDHRHLIEGSVVLLATGVMDRYVPLPGLVECFGLSVYVCPDCDGFEALDRHTFIIGSGDAGANMAIALTYWTNNLTFINHELKPISESCQVLLEEHGIVTIHESISKIISASVGQLIGVELQSGQILAGDKAFIAFGSNEVRTGLARQLGAEQLESGHIITDPRTKMTSVTNLWAAGDIGVHSEMLTVAMAEGTLSAVWMHKALVGLGRKALHYQA